MSYLDVINELNEMLYDKHGELCEVFELRSSGYYNAIFIYDVRLWLDDDDDRWFDEEKNDYEPLVPFIIKEYNKLIDEISKRKL